MCSALRKYSILVCNITIVYHQKLVINVHIYGCEHWLMTALSLGIIAFISEEVVNDNYLVGHRYLSQALHIPLINDSVTRRLKMLGFYVIMLPIYQSDVWLYLLTLLYWHCIRSQIEDHSTLVHVLNHQSLKDLIHWFHKHASSKTRTFTHKAW